jgi:hypothetical protein
MTEREREEEEFAIEPHDGSASSEGGVSGRGGHGWARDYDSLSILIQSTAHVKMVTSRQCKGTDNNLYVRSKRDLGFEAPKLGR